MRLLHTKDLTFTEFFDSDIPKYAILSHRWGKDEVSYKEMRKGTAQPGKGLSKIHACCKLAASQGLQWVWIDTCCIDKRSSAELSEAINSMWRWYAGAVECFAYLADVLSDYYEGNTNNDNGRVEAAESEEWGESDTDEEPLVDFQASVWFTRGWTLQELLAPAVVIFYDRRWQKLGDKRSLRDGCSKATGIEGRFFHYYSDFERSTTSVAMKMSWVSMRQTSRIEDLAYCLIGLFGVNMPLLYGEGHNAFMRLQLELIKHTADDSIFAWTTEETFESLQHGLLAPSPRNFATCGNIMRVLHPQPHRIPWTMTNIGLEIHVPIPSWWERMAGTNIEQRFSYYVLGCYKKKDDADKAFNTLQDLVKIKLQEVSLAGWHRVPDTALQYEQQTWSELYRRDTMKIYVPQPGFSLK